VGKGKRVDVYLEERKRREHTFFNETSACGTDAHILMLTSIYQHVKKATVYYMCIVYLHLRTRVAQ
jgi:hypothetical protein